MFSCLVGDPLYSHGDLLFMWGITGKVIRFADKDTFGCGMYYMISRPCCLAVHFFHMSLVMLPDNLVSLSVNLSVNWPFLFCLMGHINAQCLFCNSALQEISTPHNWLLIKEHLRSIVIFQGLAIEGALRVMVNGMWLPVAITSNTCSVRCAHCQCLFVGTTMERWWKPQPLQIQKNLLCWIVFC